jgi:ATP-dependent DNA helicase
MEVLLYHAPTRDDRTALRSKHMPYGPPKESTPVIVTSYEVAMNDRRFLARHKWKYIIVDEVNLNKWNVYLPIPIFLT